VLKYLALDAFRVIRARKKGPKSNLKCMYKNDLSFSDRWDGCRNVSLLPARRHERMADFDRKKQFIWNH